MDPIELGTDDTTGLEEPVPEGTEVKFIGLVGCLAAVAVDTDGGIYGWHVAGIDLCLLVRIDVLKRPWLLEKDIDPFKFEYTTGFKITNPEVNVSICRLRYWYEITEGKKIFICGPTAVQEAMKLLRSTSSTTMKTRNADSKNPVTVKFVGEKSSEGPWVVL